MQYLDTKTELKIVIMHIVLMTRGIKKEVDDFINQLQGKYLPFQVKEGAAGLPKGDYQLQMRVAPVQLWDISFPEQHRDLVLTTIFGKTGKGKPINRFMDKLVFGLRKMLKLKPIPEYDTTHEMPINKTAIEMIGIGLKDDYEFPDGTEAI